MPKSIFEYIVQQQKDRRPFALATVIETHGSVSARTAAKALIKEALIESEPPKPNIPAIDRRSYRG